MLERGWDEPWEGEITGAIGSGLFIRFGEVFEGLLPARRLHGEFYELNPTGTALVGRRSGRRYRLGDTIRGAGRRRSRSRKGRSTSCLRDMNSAVTEIAFLRAIPLFAALDDDGLRRVAAVSVELDIPAGQTLVHAGDPGSGIFVILSGTAIVEARGETMIEVGPGEFVGELALLVPEATRSARVRAKTDVHCLAIFAGDFRQLLARRAADRARDAPRASPSGCGTPAPV